MTKAPLFAPKTIHDPATGGRRSVQVVQCRECPETLEVRVNNAGGAMSDETIMRKARLKGWTFGRKGRDVVCGACVRSASTTLAVHKLRSEPEAMRAALTIPPGKTEELVVDAIRLEAVLDSGAHSLAALESRIETTGAGARFDEISIAERLKKEPEPMNATVTPIASSSPRQPSREDKRRVLEKLNEVYDGEETGYSRDWSDAKVAASLSVPPRWVTDLRVEFHGENAGNEATDKEAKARRRAINELRADIERIESRLLSTLADTERAIGPLKARLARLDGEQA